MITKGRKESQEPYTPAHRSTLLSLPAFLRTKVFILMYAHCLVLLPICLSGLYVWFLICDIDIVIPVLSVLAISFFEKPSNFSLIVSIVVGVGSFGKVRHNSRIKS